MWVELKFLQLNFRVLHQEALLSSWTVSSGPKLATEAKETILKFLPQTAGFVLHGHGHELIMLLGPVTALWHLRTNFAYLL